jgi:catechol 2,3-dioxygenase-like lactoylglutathione lyase family enzyme/CheY-like chemotaxis protein
MKISRLDHLVLTVRDIEATCAFYQRVMGMEVVSFGEGRKALLFGTQKINLHQKGHEHDPKAQYPTPGSADLCFIAETPLGEVGAHLRSQEIAILEGPVVRAGATGQITSLYFRDPDDNLIEVSNTAPAVPPAPSQLKILYLESNPRFASVTIKAFLSRHDITLVSNLSAARQELAVGKFDVVLVDYALEDGQGDDLVYDLKAQRNRPVIIATSPLPQGNAALMEAGADAACGKMEFQKIEAVMAEALERKAGG